MAKLRRTLLIGLGGTGVKTILNAKKMFYENYGEIPPMIGFIGVDTDKPGLNNNFVIANDGEKISLDNSEQLCISVSAPMPIYTNNRISNLFDWMPESNVQGLSALSIGAGQMRSNGRFAITVNENNVKQFISNKITQINQAEIINNTKYDLLASETEVHMVFSLGGGTGSGTFLNMAYLIKRLFPTIKMSGYAVLSDVFSTMVSGAMSARVKPNGKGAIIDLDYLAHLTPNSEPVNIKWFHDSDRITNSAFDAIYFIDNRNDNNDTFKHVDPLCQMISLAIVTSVGELGVAMASVSDNVCKLIADGTMDIRNKKAWVAGFGCSEIVFEGKRLATLYTEKAIIQLINKMLNGGCDDPSIIANNWFDNTKIRENQGRDDVIDYFMSSVPRYVLTDIDNPDNPRQETQDYINNRAQESQATLNEKIEQLKANVDDSLSRLLKDQANRECGIYLCSKILLSILHQIDLCDDEMKEEIQSFEDKNTHYEVSYDTACRELSECMSKFFKRNRKEYEEEVVTQTTNIAIKQREITRRKMARQFYSWLRERVNQSIDRVNVIITNLQTVVNDCNKEIERILRIDAGGNFFQFDLSTKSVSQIECPMADIVFNNFTSFMQSDGGIASLTALTSDQTKDILKRFVRTLPKVKEYNKMTIDDAIDNLNENEFKELLHKAFRKSSPLLSYTYRGYETDINMPPVECYYIGVANKNISRLVKNDILKELVSGAQDVQFSEVGLSNRIIIYRQLGVLPAYTITALENYDSDYERWETNKPHGSHWDSTLCQRMKQERYSLSPKNTVDQRRTFDLWVKAIIYDLIKYNDASTQYQVKSRGMGGRPLQGWLVNIGSSRQEAFRCFEDNMDILENEINNEIDNMEIPGPNNPIRQLSQKAIDACRNCTYLETVSKCPVSQEYIEHYPEEEAMINKEMEYILDNLA